MTQLDPDTFASVASRLAGHASLTPAEHAELLRLAQGFACKDSAAEAQVSPETIRARRKRIYRKLGLEGAAALVSRLLAVSLERLARGEPPAPARSDAAAPAGVAGR